MYCKVLRGKLAGLVSRGTQSAHILVFVFVFVFGFVFVLQSFLRQISRIGLKGTQSPHSFVFLCFFVYLCLSFYF